LQSNQGIIGKILTALSTPLLALLALLKIPVHADAPKHWSVPIHAPALPNPFLPRAYRWSDHGPIRRRLDPSGNARDASRDEQLKRPTIPMTGTRRAPARMARPPTFPWAMHPPRRNCATRTGPGCACRPDVLPGQCRRPGGEDKPEEATADYQQWRSEQISQFLVAGVDQNATDHSTIVTNPEHARRAAAYDVAVGVCTLTEKICVSCGWRRIGGMHSNYLMLIRAKI
jgi:hypothetical protein